VSSGLNASTRHHRPSNRRRDVGRVDETERIEAVESAVVETGRHFLALDDFCRPHRFGMAGQERRDFFRIGFMRVGVGFRGNQVVVRGLRGVDRKYRTIDYRRPPLLAIGQPKQKSQATDRVGSIANIGIAAAEREAADDRRAAGLEQSGLREARSLATAIERAADAHAFGMIAAERRVPAPARASGR
jgi:hypothetical protein